MAVYRRAGRGEGGLRRVKGLKWPRYGRFFAGCRAVGCIRVLLKKAADQLASRGCYSIAQQQRASSIAIFIRTESERQPRGPRCRGRGKKKRLEQVESRASSTEASSIL